MPRARRPVNPRQNRRLEEQQNCDESYNDRLQ